VKSFLLFILFLIPLVAGSQVHQDIGIYFRPTTDPKEAILGYEGIKLALEENGYENQVGYLKNLDEETLKKIKVLIIPCVYGFQEEESRLRSRLRRFVENGGGMILLHEAIGWRRVWSRNPVFPEIGSGCGEGDSYLDSFTKGVGPMTTRYVDLKVFDSTHPLASSIQGEIKVLFDMPEIKPGEKGQVVFIRKDTGTAAVVAGQWKQGRVVLVAPNLGLGPRNMEQPPAGEGLKLLLNCVLWVQGKEKR